MRVREYEVRVRVYVGEGEELGNMDDVLAKGMQMMVGCEDWVVEEVREGEIVEREIEE